MTQLALSNIVNVSVGQAPAGLGEFNVNNVILFTDETPSPVPAAGYTLYKTPEDVATDYGSSSQTAQMANEIFAQSPNILAGGGSLIIAPLLLDLDAVIAEQKITFSGTPASGAWTITYLGSEVTGSLADNISAANVQVALRLLAGLSAVTVTGSVAAGFIVTFTGVSGPVADMTVQSTMVDADSNAITGTVATIVPGVASGATEALLPAIQRLQPLVSFCGIIKTDAYVTNELFDAARYVQTQNMILVVQSASAADATVTTGIFWQIMSAALSQTRCVMYRNGDFDAASLMAAAYMGRGFSTDFTGSNTTQDMQLKTLLGIVADEGMDQTTYAACQVAGVDVYPSVQGVAKVLTSGANRFFDQVYNQMWFTTDIQISVFNAMAETPTKIPQTEAGVTTLKAAAQQVCEQAKTNLYCAPGVWTGGTFGNQQDFLRNIRDVGYYVYSTPIAQQSQADRNARKAPLLQIALKEAGAVDSAQILVNINA